MSRKIHPKVIIKIVIIKPHQIRIHIPRIQHRCGINRGKPARLAHGLVRRRCRRRDRIRRRRQDVVEDALEHAARVVAQVVVALALLVDPAQIRDEHGEVLHDLGAREGALGLVGALVWREVLLLVLVEEVEGEGSAGGEAVDAELGG